MLAYDYPLLGIFWTMLVFFVWVAWILLLIRVFADIFRSRDMGGVAKALWSIFVILLPFLGTLLYLIINGRGMYERDAEQAKVQEQAVQDYVRSVAGTTSSADELVKLADLRDRGVISEDEFAQQKAKLLS